VIVGAVILSWMLSRPIPMRPSKVSKANTAAQIVLIALVLGARGGFEVFSPLTGPAIYIAGALTVVSGAAYLVEWLRHMAGFEDVQYGADN
jgi:cardiolipin synthase